MATMECPPGESGVLHYVLTTPCLRESLIFGISAGCVVTTGQFMFSGRSRRSLKHGLVTIGGVTSIYFAFCRYFRAKQDRAVQKFFEKQRSSEQERVLRMYGRKNVEAYEKLFAEARRKEEKRS
eukprot:scpid20273/ scgid14459/ 